MKCNQICRVKPGQTLIDIALANNCNVWKLKQVNKLEHCNLLPGQEIILEYDFNQILQRDMLKTMNISIPIYYFNNQEHVQGNLQICYDFMIFTPNLKKMNKKLKGKEEHYHFSVYIKEIYSIIFNPIAELIQIIVWGICGKTIKDEDNQQMLLIELKSVKGETKLVKSFVRELWQIKRKNKNMITTEALSYLLQLLQLEHDVVQADSISTRLSRGEKNIECLSSIYNFNYVEINKNNGSIEIYSSKPIQMLQEQNSIITLNEESRILSMKQVLEIVEGIPQYLQQKPWYLLYSINRHGSSYQEFLRRTEYAGPHVIVIKDQGKKIFGSFLLNSWKLSKHEFFGSGESFLFYCLFNRTKIFKSSNKNTCYQMADETGFSIGAGDKYGLFINSQFNKGESNPCETFDNEILSTEINFIIQEFEVWGLDIEAIHQLSFQNQKQSLFIN